MSHDTRRILLRAVVFLFAFFTVHWLLQWLHPMGAHAFFQNLVLGALAAWLVARFIIGRFWYKNLNQT
jgi:hypothetical protein